MNQQIEMNIYVKDLQADDTHNLVTALSNQAGVLSAKMNAYIQRLVTITFNYEQVAGSLIIQNLAKQGFQGRLIGI